MSRNLRKVKKEHSRLHRQHFLTPHSPRTLNNPDARSRTPPTVHRTMIGHRAPSAQRPLSLLTLLTALCSLDCSAAWASAISSNRESLVRRGPPLPPEPYPPLRCCAADAVARRAPRRAPPLSTHPCSDFYRRPVTDPHAHVARTPVETCRNRLPDRCHTVAGSLSITPAAHPATPAHPDVARPASSTGR